MHRDRNMTGRRAPRAGALLALAISLVSALPRLCGAEEAPVALALPHSIQPQAACKVDPRILFALAQQRRSEVSLSQVGRQIVMLGTSEDALTFPVLMRTTLDDAQLASLGAPPDSRAGDIVTATVRAADIDRLASDPGVLAIEASAWLAPTLDMSIPDTRANLVNQADPPAGYNGQGVLYGLVDDGIDISHEDFKDEQGKSRILYIWDHFTDGNPPAGFGYGREYTKAQIDAGQANGFVDVGGHGAHVAGISVGDGSSRPDRKYRGVAWKADIIAVRNGYCDLFCYGGGIPPWGGANSKGAVDGMTYLLQKKQQLGRPLVVNQSQGTMMGPHDGSTLLEAAYDNMIEQQGLIVCIAAGNDEQAGWHGQADVSPGGQGNIVLQHDTSQGAAATLVWECWYKEGDAFSWQLSSPGGGTVTLPAVVDPPDAYPGVIIPGAHSDTLFYWTTTSTAVNSQGYASFFLQNRRLGVQGGAWTVRAVAANQLPRGGVVDLYCERNQHNLAVTQGVNTDAIVGMPGSCARAITVASHNTKLSWTASDGNTYNALNENPLGDISSFSSWGPLRGGALKPDLCAPGAWIMSVLANGHQQDAAQIDPDMKHMIISGTSMATPHVSGAIALMLQKKPTLTPTEAKQILTDTARTDGFTGTVPNKKFGYGKLDVKAAVDAVGVGPLVCASTAGDANGDAAVNILDVVCVVNDILDTVHLDDGGRACADMDESTVIDITDVLQIVNVILSPGAAARSLDSPAPAVRWSQSANEDAVQVTFPGTEVGGVQMRLVLPRGCAVSGGPRLRGASEGSVIRGSERVGVLTVVAYQPSGVPLASGDRDVVVELPIEKRWEGGQDAASARVTQVVLSDVRGGRLAGVEQVPGRDPLVAPLTTGAGPRSEPNPTPGVSTIRYLLPANGEVALTVYDAGGRLVRCLWSGWQMSGDHSVVWDGRDDRGRRVPAGAYYVRVEGGGATASTKVLVLR